MMMTIWTTVLKRTPSSSISLLVQTHSRCIPLRRLSTKVQQEVETVSKDHKHKLCPVAGEIVRLRHDLNELVGMKLEAEKNDDKEFQRMAASDLKSLEDQIKEMERDFMLELANSYRIDPIYDKCKEILIEISPGVGGQEAMLFSRELFQMYSQYAQFKQWSALPVQYDVTDLGGLRQGGLLITSPEAYSTLQLEAGVHRVQRVPKTEKAGRIHTSTSTVAVLPTLEDIDIRIDDKDLRIEPKKASGPGGQSVNTTESAVRITHIPSGISVDSQSERSQIRNKQLGIRLILSKLHKLEHEKNLRLGKELRKDQIGYGERSDKIRTYQFLQDRITDHRFGHSSHNIPEFMQGTDHFDDFLNEIRQKQIERILKDIM